MLFNLSFLSDEHIDAIRYTADEARRLGMRVDITLGSGWPLGGPHIPVTQAASVLRREIVRVGAGERSAPMPSLASGERMVATFVREGGERSEAKAAGMLLQGARSR